MAWCMSCRKVFSSGTEICPDCGDLLETGEPPKSICNGDCGNCVSHCEDSEEHCTGGCDAGIWPKYDNGEPVEPALFMTVHGNQLDYQLAVTQLQSFGVPVVGTFSASGTLAKMILGFAGTGMDILIPETMVELATELMKPVEVEE